MTLKQAPRHARGSKSLRALPKVSQSFPEFAEDFCRLLNQLKTTIAVIATELMEEEKITCEAESELLWLEAEGYPQAFSLRLMLLQGRCGEGEWSAIAVTELMQALEAFTNG